MHTRNSQRIRFRLGFAETVLLLAPTLLEAPVLAADSYLVVRLATLAPFWCVIAYQALVRPSLQRGRRGQGQPRMGPRIGRAGLVALGLLWVLLLIALARSMVGGVIDLAEGIQHVVVWGTMIGFAWCVLMMPRSPDHYRLGAIIVASLGLFLVINIGLHIAGVRNAAYIMMDGREPARMLGALGIDTFRTSLPMASRMNGVGMVAGACLTGAAIMALLSRSSRERMLLVVWSAASTYTLGLTDSRAATVLSVLVIVFCGFAPWRFLSASRFLAVLSPILPIIILLLGVALASTEATALLGRGSSDVASATGRDLIWSLFGMELAQFDWTHLIGFGYLGTAASGIASVLGSIFSVAFDENRLTLHNTLFQYVIDLGYLGGILLVYVQFAGLSSIPRATLFGARDPSRVYTGLLIFLLLIGTTEAAATIYQPETFLLFNLCAVLALSLPRRHAAPAQPQGYTALRPTSGPNDVPEPRAT